ncbi:MAG: ABC transporter ATP-binding protein [Rhodospirillales bacterium]|nr:ABC transporter ATP-binding protein [Rhodospirillales bacterium]
MREAFLGGGSDRLGATPRRAPDEVTAPLLSIRGVEKHFGGVPAIQSFSLSLHRGEFCGLIGPNGAGKTTLMNLLTGYMRPSAGEIVFDGQAIVGLRPYQCCRLGIARTFQIVRPFPEMSVLDNVVTGWMFAGDAASRRRPEADVRAECVALLELVGLGGRLGSPSGSLTLGEKKRLELARALATRPRLLLLDEVLGGLSDAEIVQMCAVLRQVHARGITILMIEHVIRALVRLVDRLVVLNFGRNLRDGPPAEVLADPMVVEAYLGRPLAVDDARHPMTDQLHD